MTSIFQTIKAIRSASAPAHKAWNTRKANADKRSAIARKAWQTRKANAH
jgi:hypothetical protein